MLPKGKEQQMAERVRAVNAMLLESCFFSTQRQVRATRVRVRARVRVRVRGSPALLHPAPGGLLRLGLGVGLGLGLPLTLTPTPTPKPSLPLSPPGGLRQDAEHGAVQGEQALP